MAAEADHDVCRTVLLAQAYWMAGHGGRCAALALAADGTCQLPRAAAGHVGTTRGTLRRIRRHRVYTITAGTTGERLLLFRRCIRWWWVVAQLSIVDGEAGSGLAGDASSWVDITWVRHVLASALECLRYIHEKPPMSPQFVHEEHNKQ